VLLASLSPESLDAYFASATLRQLTKRTICTEPALRRALQDVRERGWAFADQESEDGVRTVAAPLYNRSLTVQAAINVAGHASRVSMKALRAEHLPLLLDAARDISSALGANVDTLYKRRTRLTR